MVRSRSDSGRNDFLRYAENAITVAGPEKNQLGAAVKKAGAYTVIGVIERDQETSGGTFYCTAIFFGPDGKLLGKHRKLKPTGSERLIWGEGDGSTLPVFDTPYDKIGSLICWENYMPLARPLPYPLNISIQHFNKHLFIDVCYFVQINVMRIHEETRTREYRS